MSENPVGDALDELETSLDKMDVAGRTLHSVLESLGIKPSAYVCSCVLYTMESAVEHGQASLEIVRRAIREPVRDLGKASARIPVIEQSAEE